MAPKSKPITELGEIDKGENTFRAHVNFRDASGKQVNIRGPKRGNKTRAEADLVQMRAAGAVGKTREQGIQIMAAEALRIQVAAEYEAEQRAAAFREREAAAAAEAEEVKEEDLCYPPSDSDPDNEPWLQEYPEEPTPVDVAPSSQKPKLTSSEATLALKRFRPLRSRPADLEHLLACRADPNATPDVGGISPLRNVMTFATEAHVEQMRKLLLDCGAHESEDDRDRWVLRQRADFCERVRVNNERDVAESRKFSPTGAALDMDFW